MAYRKKTYRFKNSIEVVEYHTARYGAPGQKREKKKKVTPEQIEQRNQYNREKQARHQLRKYFTTKDYLVDLTYRPEERPKDMKEAKEHFSKAMRIVRREYKKRGYELRWRRNIEVGKRNAWHVHLVINRIPDTDLILKNAWTQGKVVMQMLNEEGDFAKLAAYITKTPRTDSRLVESSSSASRNMPLPEPEKKDYYFWKTWKKIKIPEGFYLYEERSYEGENPLTGYKYRTYTLLRCKRE